MAIGEIIDRKFIIRAENPCNKKRYTERNAFLFCAKDKAFLQGALPGYLNKCRELGCSTEHLESIARAMERVAEFQRKVESRIPDTDGDCEVDRCIGGLVHSTTRLSAEGEFDYKFSLYQRVTTPFSMEGIVVMLGYNDGGRKYYVQTASNSGWFKESQLSPTGVAPFPPNQEAEGI